MQYEEFVGRVQERAGLGSYGAAEDATRAVLQTLGEYLSGGEGLDLASQLPQGIEDHLINQPPDRAKIFSLQDFVQIIGEKEDTGPDRAQSHARAVIGVLGEAVTEGEMQDIRRQFPSAFDPIFD
ncbi:MAG: DUF2267 domain-containing protein [Rubrobacter sp.]|nr:DUF2267 domain-containing protein [Rubrobacter sp.]